MKKLFLAIRHCEVETVKELIEKKPELISCTAKQPPKKDDGQSPLQVAIKTGNWEIAHYLLDKGADVNFMESEECCNEFRIPALHDAIMAAVLSSRFVRTNFDGKGYMQCSTKKRADDSFALLERMVTMGADVNGCDSYGNSALTRAVLDANQILPGYDYLEHKVRDGEPPITKELREDLTRIFNLLLSHGANKYYINCREGWSHVPLIDECKERPVGEFLLESTR